MCLYCRVVVAHRGKVDVVWIDVDGGRKEGEIEQEEKKEGKQESEENERKG